MSDERTVYIKCQGEGWVLRKPSAAERARLLDRREKESDARTGSDFISLG
jgi:hypothetical protein